MVREIGEKLTKEYVVGYKVVVKRVTKRGKVKYFSGAMGFEYKDGKVPVIRKQYAIWDHISHYILGNSIKDFWRKLRNQSQNCGFRHFYLGKTAAFKTIKQAQKYAEQIYRQSEKQIVQVKLYGDISTAYDKYGNSIMYLGTHMNIIKEVKCA